MIALFFEVLPKHGLQSKYFEMAAKLKPALDASGGLVFLDRSASMARPGWFLSYQLWRDEESLERWRANPAHHRAQVCGRTDILADYRLRVGRVVATAEAAHQPLPPGPSDRWIVSALSDGPLPGVPGEPFTSVYDSSLIVNVIPVATAQAGQAVLAHARTQPGLRHACLCQTIRDYGIIDRREAPQHFEPVSLS